MADTESNNFCRFCGAPLRESDTFCGACGASIRSNPSAASSGAYARPQPKTNRLMIAGALSVVLAAVTIALGLYAIITSGTLADTLVSSFTQQDMTVYDEYEILRDYIADLLVVSGAMLVASGALSVVTAITAFEKKMYVVSLSTCVVSMVLSLSMLIGLVGLVVVYLIYRSKDEFATSDKTI